MAETRLSVRMSQSEIKQLKLYAQTQNLTLADWVRQTLLSQAGIREDRIAELERRLAALEERLNQQQHSAA